MKKFLVLYRMDMAEMRKMMASTSAEDRKKSMGEWEVWMKKKMASFVDSGAPVGKTKQTTKGGVADIKNDIGGYSIVQAGQVRELLDFLTWISSFEGFTLRPTIASYS